MKTVVFCGSPKGRNSVTLQTVRYLASRFSEDDFTVFFAGAGAGAALRNPALIAQELSDAALVLFAYPVYSFGPPSHVMKAVEEMKKTGLPLSGKYCTQITTSMKVLDPLAHEWVERNARDLQLRIIPGLSAGQEDLASGTGAADADAFWRFVRASVCGKTERPAPVPDRNRFKTMIITDLAEEDTALAGMIKGFVEVYPYSAEIFNVREFAFRGGCLGCLRCAPEGRCVYTDGFEQMFRSAHAGVDATVVAFSVRDHGIGSGLKRYFDRTYFNGHRAPENRSSIGYLVNGDLSSEPHLKTYLDAYTQFRHTRDCGTAVTGEGGAGLAALAARIQYSLENDYLQPRNFYGEACVTMFRDIVTEFRGVMRADYRYFRKHGLLDYAEGRTEMIRKSMQAGMLLSSPELQRDMGLTFEEAMCKAHREAAGTPPPGYREIF